MPKLFKLLVITLLPLCSFTHAFQSNLTEVDGHPIHTITWGDFNDKDKPAVILLSGPIDSWHSDSAWWAGMGKSLARSFRVLAIDRAGIATNNPNAPLGYLHLGEDLAELITQYQLDDVTVVAFSSSNMSVMNYFNLYPKQNKVKRVIMIDPDVLTEFSVNRYSDDAKPFKDNLEKYLDYIGQGKYTPRVIQKNQSDLDTLRALNTNSNEIDWDMVDKMAKARLDLENQKNLFKEIARYGEELTHAKTLKWPKSVPLIVIDTQFEEAYIEHTQDEEAKDGLLAWSKDGAGYYQDLASQSEQGQYLLVETKAHLYQFAEPEKLLQMIREFGNKR